VLGSETYIGIYLCDHALQHRLRVERRIGVQDIQQAFFTILLGELVLGLDEPVGKYHQPIAR